MDFIRNTWQSVAETINNASADAVGIPREAPHVPEHLRQQPEFTLTHHSILDDITGVNHRFDNGRRYCVHFAFEDTATRPKEVLWHLQRWDIAPRFADVEYDRDPFALAASSDPSVGEIGYRTPERTMASVAACVLGIRYCIFDAESKTVVMRYEQQYGQREETYKHICQLAAALKVESAPGWAGSKLLVPKCTSANP